jgi:hypothetical protein
MDKPDQKRQAVDKEELQKIIKESISELIDQKLTQSQKLSEANYTKVLNDCLDKLRHEKDDVSSHGSYSSHSRSRSNSF